jgi:hypothetical protein
MNGRFLYGRRISTVWLSQASNDCFITMQPLKRMAALIALVAVANSRVGFVVLVVLLAIA